MYRYLLLFIGVFLFSAVNAQTGCHKQTSVPDVPNFLTGLNGEESPVVFSQKYFGKFNLDEIKTSYEFAPVNNDSMYLVEYDEEYFRKRPGLGSTYQKMYEVYIDFKEHATKFELDEGTLWIFKITATTAVSLGFSFKTNTKIPEGARFSYYINDPFEKYHYGEVDDHTSLSFLYSIRQLEYGDEEEYVRFNDFYIEYFEPHDALFSPNLIIDQLDYGYGNRRNYMKSTILKGAHGESEFQCLNDIVCPVGEYWKEASRSVCHIYVYNRTLLGVGRRIKGSGVLINKSGSGYAPDDMPYILSVAHLFGHQQFNEENEVPILLHDHADTRIEIVVNYQYGDCGITNRRTSGETIRSELRVGNIKAIGDNFWYKQDNSLYDPKNDYVLLQSRRTIKQLTKHDLVFSGWERFKHPREGAAIGHPNGAPKKVNVANQAPQNLENGTFIMNWNVGVSEGGLSGGPVFSSSWGQYLQGIVIGEPHNPNKRCGHSESICIKFDDIYPHIRDYVGTGLSAQHKRYTTDPTYLPAHCSNCIRDNGETGIDCGGDCLPCGIEDYIEITSVMDFFSREVMESRFTTNINTGSNAVMKSGNKNLVAGESISMRGVEFQKGATLYMNIDERIMDTPNNGRGCYVPCVAMPNTFTPNDDGINDFLRVNQSFVYKWRVNVWDRRNRLIYSSDVHTVNYDGPINIWAGQNTQSLQAYKVRFTYADCKNNWRNFEQMVHVIK
ncbi:T9SS type B sorting domain-containing protein [Alkalitalea saponilacus]|uniref:C-terminal domain of CHU protein family protein n=1 Tax=Alkalitalea saponilacus TaxID=889453 RepID=A0A1T5HTM2_9BACT|nr:gliding motility-associated C-terminal domain-containing protein [Alkalitalea saponilacus]ASB48962.1 hypothetical protein CDL62_07350 [Alkalitalea saponilacus]SKC23891.1 C-terminal domain of CHU protein family protein [Alkalitalea saponilacus]